MARPVMFSAPHEDGGTFYAQGVFQAEDPPFEDFAEERQLSSWVRSLWDKAVRAKNPETNRLKMLELMWAGFHYTSPEMMREKEITNFTFLAVESAWPELVEHRPRPEPLARRPDLADYADAQAEAVDWLLDMCGFDEAREDTTRSKLKFGWCVWLITVNEQGFPCVMEWDPFDIYFNPAAVNERTLDHFFLAAPANTRMLRASYPWMKDDIKPDGYCSASYDVYERPYIENFPDRSGWRGEGTTVPTISKYPAVPGPGSTELAIAAPGGVWLEPNDTTFLLQLYIRDYRTRHTVYEGYREIDHPTRPGAKIQVPGAYYETDDPNWGAASAPSGWSVIRMLSNGKFLKPHGAPAGVNGCVAPLDPCFGGLPIVIGKDYRHGGRMYCPGEQDMIVSPNRHYNIRKNDLNVALKFEATPVLKATGPINRQFDKDAIDAGDVLELQRGSDAEWMQFEGPSQQQFELLGVGKQDMQMVGAINDAQVGQRPTGIEANSALQTLIAQASKRVRGKEGASLREYTAVLVKCMGVLAHKYRGPIGFQSRNGEWVEFDPREFMEQWTMRFTEGTSLRSNRLEAESKMLAFFQAGAIPPIELLKQTRYPQWRQVGAMMMAQQQAKERSQISTSKGEGGPGGGEPE